MRGETRQFKGLVENEKIILKKKKQKGYRLIFNFLLLFSATRFSRFSQSHLRGATCTAGNRNIRDGTNGAQQWDFASRRYRRFISIIIRQRS